MLTWLRQTVWPIILRTWEGWNKDDGFLLSAAMAYYAAFSLFPLCLILIALLGLVMRFSPVAQDSQQQLLEVVSQNASPWLAARLSDLLAGVEERAGVSGPIGIFTLLLAAIGAFMQFENMFDRIWGSADTGPAKGWLATLGSALYDRFSAFLMLLAVGGLIMLLFFADFVLAAVRPYVVEFPAGVTAWRWGQSGLTIVFNSLLFAIIYKTLPKAPVPWRPALVGGLAVALVWELGQQVLAMFVIGENYTAYGLVGSFIAIMIWAYYASAIVFLGAEFVQAICQECGSGKASA